MRAWEESPAAELETVFCRIARTRMAGLPICNPSLSVEALGFRRGAEGQWVGAMVTPWAINLLCLPGDPAVWPAVAAGGRQDWRFPSGGYEFTVAEEDSLGCYHLCSLFSPALEFESHEAARLTALAAIHVLFEAPLAAPSRRAFLGLRG
jgi:[NiFe] hydrogenase assembly HybE family chaperone